MKKARAIVDAILSDIEHRVQDRPFDETLLNRLKHGQQKIEDRSGRHDRPDWRGW